MYDLYLINLEYIDHYNSDYLADNV